MTSTCCRTCGRQLAKQDTLSGKLELSGGTEWSLGDQETYQWHPSASTVLLTLWWGYLS